MHDSSHLLKFKIILVLLPSVYSFHAVCCYVLPILEYSWCCTTCIAPGLPVLVPSYRTYEFSDSILQNHIHQDKLDISTFNPYIILRSIIFNNKQHINNSSLYLFVLMKLPLLFLGSLPTPTSHTTSTRRGTLVCALAENLPRTLEVHRSLERSTVSSILNNCPHARSVASTHVLN